MRLCSLNIILCTHALDAHSALLSLPPCVPPLSSQAGYERQKGLKLACLNSHLYNETASIVSLHHLTSYVDAPLQAHPFVAIVAEHALNAEVQMRARELDRCVREWEVLRRARLAAAEQVDATASTDEAHLVEVMARFGIRAGGEIMPSTTPATNANTNTTAASSSTPAAFYQPSLGFITILARQTRALVAALDKARERNVKDHSTPAPAVATE